MNMDWWKETAERAIKAAAEAALAYIGTGAVVLSDVNWLGVASAAAMGGIISVLIRFATITVKSEPDIQIKAGDGSDMEEFLNGGDGDD